MHPSLKNLTVQLYADGASPEKMKAYALLDHIAGFTTNPSLMKGAGVQDYAQFAQALCQVIAKPLSFEVFADDLPGMLLQARKIRSFGKQVYVKVPVKNAEGCWTTDVIATLAAENTPLNITLLFTVEQVRQVLGALQPHVPALLSVFAGRIADTGVDPLPIMQACRALITSPCHQLLWASTREVYNIFQAQACGCHIITVGPDVLQKLNGIGQDLEHVCLEGIRAFKKDAAAAGLFLA